jgi:hypothetical protein
MSMALTIIGKVKEKNDDRRETGISIISDEGVFDVKMDAEGRNLLYEVGNKVKITGNITTTKNGIRRISVAGYEVFEFDEDDPDYCGN